MNMTTRIKSMTWLSCVIAGMAVAPTFALASFTPFTHVRVELDREDYLIPADYLDPNAYVSGLTGYVSFAKDVSSSFAQVGSSPYFAKARASFGETGSFAMVAEQPLDYHAHAESMWSDAFTIVGGTGTGTLSVSVQVEGNLTGAGAGSNYALFASDTPITYAGLQDFAEGNYPAPPGSRTVIEEVFDGSFSGSSVFSAEIPFTYGTTFYIASYLGAEVWFPGDGTADFFGSSRFGATAPNGVAVTGASGTAYALAAAVPEPSAYAMMLAGLGLVGFAARRRTALRIILGTCEWASGRQ